MARTFLGGVHPHDHKNLSAKKEISALLKQPEQVVIPMRMHIGAPCQPTVKAGDTVRVGEKIGEMTGLGAPIHASIAGTVLKVEPRAHISGEKVLSVVIQNDYSEESVAFHKPEHPEALSAQELIEIIKEAGITGLGGASFPTHTKISSAVGKVDKLLINAAECEPYITADYRMLLERNDEFMQGLRMLMKILDLNEAHIGIEANKNDAIKLLEEKQPLRGGNVNIHVLKTRYPQGAEKQLIDAVFGREVPPGGLPSDVGCVVFNVSTVYAVYEAIFLGKPLTHRLVTLTGGGVKRTRNVWTPIGTPLSHLIEEAEGLSEDCSLIICGGPMMGAPQFDMEAGTNKGTNCLLALTEGERKMTPQAHNPCIRCSRCVMGCPMHLQPVNIHMYASRQDLQHAEELNVLDCSECGTCSYVCPAKIALTQSMRATKSEILRQRRLAQQRKEAAQK